MMRAAFQSLNPDARHKPLMVQDAAGNRSISFMGVPAIPPPSGNEPP